ncbi:TPA: DUF2971 domain-containing protein [Clostridium perfringens]
MINKVREEFLISKFKLKNEMVEELRIKEISEQKPEKIYKFMDLSTNKLDKLNSIKNGKLWVNNAYDLNDPFECSFKFNDEPINKINYQVQKYYDYQKKTDEVLEDLKKEVYIAALTESKTSLLMWSHYAKNHTGICIEYDFEEVEKCETDTLKFLPVLYRKKMADYTPDGSLNWIYRVYACKAKEWEYEMEWRFIIYEKKCINGFLVNFVKPKCIYLGCKMEKDTKDEIIDFFKDSGIEIKSMVKNSREYKVSL